VDAILAGVDRTQFSDAAVSLIEAEYLGDAVHSLRHEAGEVSVVLLPLHTDRVVIVHWQRGIDATVVATLCHSGAATMADLVRADSARAVITDRATSRKVYETLANQFGYKPVVAA
jgi:hypothetical protein